MQQWIKEIPGAVTVCDVNGDVLYMNELSRATFEKGGRSLIGENLRACHSPSSWETIEQMLRGDRASNHYTIEKGGVTKIIHQMPWYDGGRIGGLVEISIVIPEVMPHYFRS